MEFKAIPQFTKEIKDRTVTGIFCVHGNVDDGGDRSHPGAFESAASGKNRIRFVWQHRMDLPPVAKVNYVKEVGRDGLPTKVLDFASDATGGAEVSRTYLDTERGSEILEGIKSGAIEEMSYAYNATEFDFEDVDGKQIRNLRKVECLDISDVLWGMNPATSAVKELGARTFTEHSEGVAAMLVEYAERVKRRADFRAGDGRPLGEANRKQVAGLLERLQEVAKSLDALLVESEPKSTLAETQRLYWQHQQLRQRIHELVGATT